MTFLKVLLQTIWVVLVIAGVVTGYTFFLDTVAKS
jgi:hypothetical protein